MERGISGLFLLDLIATQIGLYMLAYFIILMYIQGNTFLVFMFSPFMIMLSKCPFAKQLHLHRTLFFEEMNIMELKLE